MNIKNVIVGGLLASAMVLIGCEPAAAPPLNSSHRGFDLFQS